jgi:predicted nucleotidyltransferase
MLKRVIRCSGLKPDNIINVFSYGSRVYNTATNQSDYDFIVINNDGVNDREIRNGNYNIHIYTVDHFSRTIRPTQDFLP